MTYDAIIIGGGAAGLMCALVAGQRGRRVLVLERNQEVGKKILISGGGRCNFTNLAVEPTRFLSENPRFAQSALSRYRPADFLALLARHKIAWYEKTLGQLFCEGAGSARKIVAMLLAECAAGGVEVRTGVQVGEIVRAEAFRVGSDQGAFSAPALVLASGGLSIPKLGASDFALRIAARFGLALAAPRPGLVPLTFAGEEGALMRELAGIAAPVLARSAAGPVFAEALLFTHRGLSGPAVLQASSYWREGQALEIDLLPDAGPNWLAERKRARPQAGLAAVLGEALPQRLAAALAGSEARPLQAWRDQDLAAQLARLKTWRIFPAGTEGYAKAEVTVGGVSTRALDQKTLMAKSVPGLFVIGEAVDVTGWLGGYNFQWAWASGWAAGQAL